MKVVCISDTHGKHQQVELPDGDVLLHAGDFTRFMHAKDDFLDWFVDQPHDHKILTIGNHETMGQTQQTIQELESELRCSDDVVYVGSSASVLRGIRVGPPGTAGDVDIMVSHAPPARILDNGHGDEQFKQELVRTRPRLYVFGHIHAGYGRLDQNGTTFVNASLCVGNEYDMVNDPIVVDLEESDT